MKNKVELKNGVTLEVGKKYKYLEDIEEVIYIDEYGWLTRDQYCESSFWHLKYHDTSDWIPYEEEETEKYCKILIERTDGALTSFEECFIKEKELIHLVDRVFNYVGYDLLKEYSSKEEMIKDLKK